MAVLAVILIAGLVLGSAATVRATIPVTNCPELFYALNWCDTSYAQDPDGRKICRNYYMASATFDTSICFPSACADDGRVNTNCSAPEIVYCDEDQIDFYYYNYFTLKGEFDFSIPAADLMKSVNVKTLIKQDGAVKVFLNPDGTVLLLAPQTDGKIYFMIFDPDRCVSLREGAEWGLK